VILFGPEGRVLLDQGGGEGDTWSQEGASVRFTIGGREYTATLSQPGALSGSGWSAEPLASYPPPMH
jgi:hypothetical protein